LIEEARAGNFNPRVEAAIEMTQRVYQRGLPTMLASWWGPDWAMDTETETGFDERGLRGAPLNQEVAQEIYELIAS